MCQNTHPNSIRLPISKQTTATDTPSKPSQWLSILVVDDDERIREFHCKILESLNCEVNIASNGYEALGMLCKSYDAILMDIQMPGMDGIETAVKIRQQGFDPRTTPIIAITANPLEEVRGKCQASIFNECIQKPMDINQLQKTLEALTTR